MRSDHPVLACTRARPAPCSPATRIVFVVVWVSAIALLPARLWPWQLPSAVALAFATRRLGLSFRGLFQRTWLLWPFVGLTAIGLLGQPGWFLRAGNLVLKAVLSIWILTLLTQTTPFIDLIGDLRRLRFPAIWVELFGFLIRYANVLSDEWRRMQFAREARTFDSDWRRRLRLQAQSLGGLFLRAYERAERIHQAMLARGYRSP